MTKSNLNQGSKTQTTTSSPLQTLRRGGGVGKRLGRPRLSVVMRPFVTRWARLHLPRSVGSPISHAKMLARLFRSNDDFSGPATTPDDTAVYAIGDIHGRADLLHGIQQSIAEHADLVDCSRKVIVYLGDYVDRGPQSREVIDVLIKAPLPGFDSVYLKGNHEDALLRFLDDTGIGPSWLGFGGEATLKSYGVDLFDRSTGSKGWLHDLQVELRDNLPSSHLRFFERLKLSHREGDYFFVHAGVRPGLPLDEQRQADMMWIRDEFLESRRDFGGVVVHGHSISRQPEIRTNRIGIDTGAVFTGVLTCIALVGTERHVLQTG